MVVKKAIQKLLFVFLIMNSCNIYAENVEIKDTSSFEINGGENNIYYYESNTTKNENKNESEINDGEINNDEVNNDEVNNDQVNNDEVNNDQVNKDEFNNAKEYKNSGNTNVYKYQKNNTDDYVKIIVVIGETSNYLGEDERYTRSNYGYINKYEDIYTFNVSRDDVNNFRIINNSGYFYPFKYLINGNKSELFLRGKSEINNNYNVVVYEIINYSKTKLDVDFETSGTKIENYMNQKQVRNLIQSSAGHIVQNIIEFILGFIILYIAVVLLLILIGKIINDFNDDITIINDILCVLLFIKN